MKEGASRDSYRAFSQFEKYKHILNSNEVLDVARSETTARFLLENNKNFFYWSLKYIKDEPYLKDLLIELASTDRYNLIYQLKELKDYTYLQEVVEAIFADSLHSLSDVVKIIKDKPFTKDLLFSYARRWSFYFLFSDVIKELPYAEELFIEFAKTDPPYIIYCLEKYKGIPYKDKMLEVVSKEENYSEVLKKNPFTILDSKKEIAHLPFSEKIISLASKKETILSAVENYPLRTFEYIYLLKEVGLLKEALLIATKKLPYKFIEVADSESIHELDNKNELAMIAISTLVDDFSKEQSKDNYLKLLRWMNNLHEYDREVRFYMLKNLSLDHMYSLIVQWREEIYTSTFYGIVDNMLIKLEAEGIDIAELVKRNGKTRMGKFLEACASFDRIDDVLNTIDSKEKQGEFLFGFIQEFLDNEKNMVTNAISIAEILSSSKNEGVIKVFESLIVEKYTESINSWRSKYAIVLWLIASSHAKKSWGAWFAERAKEYELPPMEIMPSNDLFDSKRRNIQRYHFYKDKDWEESFNNFLIEYWFTAKEIRNMWKEESVSSEKWWKLENNEDYISLVKENKDTGKSIHIFANKPEQEYDYDLRQIMEKMELESIVVVHRGHSYHLRKTIEKIPKIARMVFVGSCWGYQNIWKIIGKAPLAHIISTKWTWSKFVNDPMFKEVTERILNGEDIDWEKVWDGTKRRIETNPAKNIRNYALRNLKKYIRPDKNFWTLFYKAFMKYSSK